MHYNIYTKKNKFVRTCSTLANVKLFFRLSNTKLSLLADGDIVISMGLRFIAMKCETYKYYGKLKYREVYYTKPKYTLDDMPKSYKKTITYSNVSMAHSKLSLCSSSSYFDNYYTNL